MRIKKVIGLKLVKTIIVFFFSEILCPLAISNGNIASCANTVGAECKNYSCDQGFQKNGAVQSLTCSVSGSWTYDISIFCPALLTGKSSGAVQFLTYSAPGGRADLY